MKKVLFLLCLITCNHVRSQDIALARKLVDTLTSPYFWGRGYTKDGMKKAGSFIAEQYKSFGLQPIGSRNFKQNFSYPANTFPGRMELKINGRQLVAGKDFIVLPESGKIHASGILKQKDSANYVNQNYRFIVNLQDKLTWSVAPDAADFAQVIVNRKSIDAIPINFEADVENKIVENFEAANVCAWVKGTLHPDSIIVLSAHYDHLGGMGNEVFFPGANDNASGTSLLLTLARYYAAHPQPYTIAFLSFAGEEAGLIGSKYFTKHPLFPLDKIRFLLNLDLEGTGDEGVTIVNATEYPKEFKQLNEVNDNGKYLTKINARGKAANSDHYWFSEKKVPAFFMYTLGGIKAYHDVFDKAETLPMNEYEDLFRLVVGFNEKLMGK